MYNRYILITEKSTIYNCFSNAFYQQTRFFKWIDYFSDIIHFFIWDYQCSQTSSKKFFWIAASVSDAAAGNPNVINTLWTNGFSTVLLKGNPVFSNGPESLPRNYPVCPILCSWVFDNFILAGRTIFKTFTKPQNLRIS